MSIQYLINEYFVLSKDDINTHKRPLYQPVYNHPEYNYMVSNLDYDKRIQLICKIIEDYIAKTGKKIVHILDLGSAEGYIDFQIKEKFKDLVHIVGYDINEGSVKLSQFINDELNWNLEFNKHNADNISLISEIPNGKFDIVFLFNILHWTSIQDKGWENSKKWLEKLACKTNLLLLELAGFDNKTPSRTPQQYSQWFNNISFFIKIADLPHFVNNEPRPLYLASNIYAYVFDKFYNIDTYHKSFNGMRRAYLSNNQLIKIVYKNYHKTSFNISANACIDELKNEINNCDKNLSFAPKILNYEENNEHFLSLLQLKRIGISPVYLDINNYRSINNKLLDILDNLIECEQKKLFHYDLTLWNMMEDKSGKAFLIDIGALIENNICDGGNSILKEINPEIDFNSYDAFVGIVWDILVSNNNKFFEEQILKTFVPTIFFDEDTYIPNEYKNFFKKYQSLKRNDITFVKIKDIFLKYVIEKCEIYLTDEENIIYGLTYEKRKTENSHLRLLCYKKVNS